MQQPGSQVENATVAHPGVAMERDGVQGGQTIQEPVREVSEIVVVEVELSGLRGETDGQQRGCERPAAAVHLSAMAGTKVRAG